MTQVPWFMHQNGLGPSDGIYYPNFVPCFVVLYLNFRFRAEVKKATSRAENPERSVFFIKCCPHTPGQFPEENF